jgi:hypothetical protein
MRPNMAGHESRRFPLAVCAILLFALAPQVGALGWPGAPGVGMSLTLDEG